MVKQTDSHVIIISCLDRQRTFTGLNEALQLVLFHRRLLILFVKVVIIVIVKLQIF